MWCVTWKIKFIRNALILFLLAIISLNTTLIVCRILELLERQTFGKEISIHWRNLLSWENNVKYLNFLTSDACWMRNAIGALMVKFRILIMRFLYVSYMNDEDLNTHIAFKILNLDWIFLFYDASHNLIWNNILKN